MDYAIYKCEQCGEKFHMGLRKDQLCASQLGFSEESVAKQWVHHCDENTIGIAKLIGFKKKTE